ncbi:MAG TPA: D-aminoacyl-tRNA deacylase [Tepidisphaeraceae bacterium]|nr:D-aminoacyl-tRNA deacylase [Tepidisphaeraceae bacterium]
MIAVIQRVTQASVTVNTRTVGAIERGILALVAVHKTDTSKDVEWMAKKLTALRIFPNREKNFDQDVLTIAAGILLVSNFTVAAATAQGRRPSLDAAADPVKGRELFDQLIKTVRATGVTTATGEFGGDMRVSLQNDGPVTFIVDSRPSPA